MSEIIITEDNFEDEVLNSELPVLVDFWATWCGPCKMLSPVISEIAKEQTDIKVGKINVDEQPELANAFQVMSIPTVIMFKDGKAAKVSVGYRPKNQLEEIFELK